MTHFDLCDLEMKVKSKTRGICDQPRTQGLVSYLLVYKTLESRLKPSIVICYWSDVRNNQNIFVNKKHVVLSKAVLSNSYIIVGF